MSNRLRNFHFLILSILLFFIQASHAEEEFNDIYVLGDSLSDTGNLASINGDLPFPFFENRISNGPVAVETLARKLNLSLNASLHLTGPAEGNNYAVAGARSAGESPIDLQNQVDALLANNLNKLPESALYVIIIGGNDVRDARDSSDLITSLEIINKSVRGIIGAVNKLNKAGAKHFLISNSPNIGTVPETRLLADVSGSEFIIKKATGLSVLFDKSLKVSLSVLFSKKINVIDFDLFEATNELVKNAEAFGFANSQDACFGTSTSTFNPECNNGEFFDRFVFFDELHPSARAHRFLGGFMFDQVVSSENLAIPYF